MPTTPRKPSADPTRLRDLLEKLHEELRTAQAMDPHTRELLHDLQHDTRALLERGGEAVTAGHGRLRDLLTAEVAGLESTHPDLALAMARVIDILSGLGI